MKNSIPLLAIFMLSTTLVALAQLPNPTSSLNKNSPQLLHTATPHQNPPNLEVVSERQWNQIDNSVDRGLDWLSRQQRSDGAFPSTSPGNPAITSLCIMAFLSRGHLPGEGHYGQVLNNALTYVLSCQRSDGIFSALPININDTSTHGPTQTGVYNTTITGLMLGELYGMTNSRISAEIQPAIERTLEFMAKHQQRSQAFDFNKGGVRYLFRHNTGIDADLSVTAWHVMLMRSAVNAGFEVPGIQAEQSITYVRNCYVDSTGQFRYTINEPNKVCRAMTGAGVLCLFLTGQYDNTMEAQAGDYLLNESFHPYNVRNSGRDHYHYAAYYVSQAMLQLGGRYWEAFYPDFSSALMSGQHRDGSWEPESSNHREFGNCYTTALAILALTTPDQILPLYQR